MSSPSPARILIVDDRPENLLALEAILGGLGHQVVRAESGEEALKALLSDDFALIMLDVQMPGMDGYETAAHIKSRERTRSIPIIFLTAIDREAHQAYRGYAAGAVDFLAKPFDPWMLRAKVEVLVELHRTRQQLAAERASLAARSASLAVPAVADRLERIERLLLMAGLAADEPGPGSEALGHLRQLRRDLSGPTAAD